MYHKTETFSTNDVDTSFEVPARMYNVLISIICLLQVVIVSPQQTTVQRGVVTIVEHALMSELIDAVFALLDTMVLVVKLILV